MTSFWKFFAQSEPHLAFPKRCYSDMGIPTFWASPFPKTLVIWASPSHNNLAIWVRVRVTGDAHITRLFEMGMPKRRECPYNCERGLFVSRGGWREPKESARGAWYFFIIIILLFLLAGASAEEREVFHLKYKECLPLAVSRMEMNYNFKKLGQLFRQKNIKVPSYEPLNLLYFCLATI